MNRLRTWLALALIAFVGSSFAAEQGRQQNEDITTVMDRYRGKSPSRKAATLAGRVGIIINKLAAMKPIYKAEVDVVRFMQEDLKGTLADGVNVQTKLMVSKALINADQALALAEGEKSWLVQD